MYKIRVKNFRSIKDEVFEIKKFTILIGENSSGKSSLLKLISAIKQSLTPPNSWSTNFAFTGGAANLGGYSNTIYFNNSELPFELEFTFGKEYIDFFKEYMEVDNSNENLNKIINEMNSETTISFQMDKNLDQHHKIISKISNKSIGTLDFLFKRKNSTSKFITDLVNLSYFRFKTNEKILLKNISFTKIGFLSIIESESLKKSISEYFKNINDSDLIEDRLFNEIALLLVTQNQVQSLFGKIQYINPLHSSPSRVYLFGDPKSTYEISKIDDFIDFFSMENTLTKKALGELKKLIKKYGIADDVEILSSDAMSVKQLRVKIKDLYSNISDVGYGVSLHLPLVLKSLLAERMKKYFGSKLLIEQPEIHLHPKLHANLIELFVEMSMRTTYLIETHSEHIIRKLQVLVKEGSNGLSADDVVIYYLIREKGKSKVSKHIIESNGVLNPRFPSGFFDNTYKLSKELFD